MNGHSTGTGPYWLCQQAHLLAECPLVCTLWQNPHALCAVQHYLCDAADANTALEAAAICAIIASTGSDSPTTDPTPDPGALLIPALQQHNVPADANDSNILLPPEDPQDDNIANDKTAPW